MAESPRRVDLRLTIPPASPFRELAVELTEKFAEYVGAPAAAATELAHAVERSIQGMADSSPSASINLEMTTQDRELVVTANSGQTTRRTTCPLPD